MRHQLSTKLCKAHRKAVKSVKTQKNEMQQQSKKRADELRALDETKSKLERKQREIDEKSIEQKTKDEKLEKRFLKLIDRQRTLDESKKAHQIDEGWLAEVESNLKTAQAQIKEKNNELIREETTWTSN